MTTVTAPVRLTSASVDERGLEAAVERLLGHPDARSGRIVGVRQEASPFASRSPAEVVLLTLEDGSERSLFVKHLGREESDHPDKQCQDREIRIYEELLADGTLPVATYFGSAWNSSTQRLDVFLERIADWDLRYHALDYWFTAAVRLAELHAHFAARRERLGSCSFLLRLDASYLHQWAERALDVARGYDAELGPVLGDVVRAYDRVAHIIVRQPPTLVHNDLAPKNVLGDRASSPPRIAFVDWEVAGVGCGVLDLVHLTHGLDADSDARMRRAYCDALAGSDVLPDDADEQERLFAACALHKLMYRLAHGATWGLPIETVRRWVSDAVQLQMRV